VLGFEKGVMDMYIVIVGFQAVFNHANVHLPWGPLKYLIVTPDFHHWHHSSDEVAIDRNYAAHFAFLDHLFGTAIKGQTGFPEKYGVQGDYMPDGFVPTAAVPVPKSQIKNPGAADGDLAPAQLQRNLYAILNLSANFLPQPELSAAAASLLPPPA
jgi:sterol desaturase/sphingolipid hydroxylase (fatty acid hydroxylase superfamily)